VACDRFASYDELDFGHGIKRNFRKLGCQRGVEVRHKGVGLNVELGCNRKRGNVAIAVLAALDVVDVDGDRTEAANSGSDGL
jgi:hypothetical protein